MYDEYSILSQKNQLFNYSRMFMDFLGMSSFPIGLKPTGRSDRSFLMSSEKYQGTL